MRLLDLEPKFFDHQVELADRYHGRMLPDGTTQWGGFPVDTLHEQAEFAGADGITFLCPKCFADNGGANGTHLIQLYFENGNASEHLGRDCTGKRVRWSANGTDAADLTLSPSVHVRTGCGWHGFVKQGEIETC